MRYFIWKLEFVSDILSMIVVILSGSEEINPDPSASNIFVGNIIKQWVLALQ